MKRFLYILTLGFLLVSCRESEIKEEVQTSDPAGSEYAPEISVSFATRADGWTIDKEYAQTMANLGDTEGPNEEKPYIITQFQEGDILFISQMGTTADPELYNSKNTENPGGDAYTKNTVKNNLYVYEYKEPEEGADWNMGSNFEPYENTSGKTTPMDWSYIKGLGSVGNAFSFYALFQGNNETPNMRTVTYMNYAGNDAEWAGWSAESLGKRYGMYGAYHATSSLYTRMRFRMYPLFNLIHVTLLVPEQEADPDDPGYSGFNSKAFYNNWFAGNTSAQIYPGMWFGTPPWVQNTMGYGQAGINNAFKINWRASRSSDNDAPLVQPDGGGINTSFYLLRYDINDPYAEHPVFKLENVKQFYPQYENLNHPDEDYDYVRRYEFIAYFVAQTTFNNLNPLISIRMLTPGSSGQLYYVSNSSYQTPMSVEGTYVPYFFYGNNKNQGQIVGGDPDLGLTNQGTYTHLTLYVPRSGNETVMVSANVMPWKETYTDMTIVDRDLLEEN